MDQQPYDHQPPPITRSPSPTGSFDNHKRYVSARAMRIYAMQVRGFIEAAEVVDVEPDTLEDILDGFDDLVGLEDIEEDEEVEESVKPDTNQDALNDDEDLGIEREYLEEAETAWSKDEVKQMMFDLKENGRAYFVNEYVVKRAISIPKLLYAFNICLCRQLREKRLKTLLYFLEVALTRELESREKLSMYNTVDDVVDLIRKSKRIMILTGAGISVSCGIPDFRSRDGLYATLQRNGEYNLDDPQQMFDIQYFKENPAVFYSFASQIYPANFIPSPCHRFIKLIEDKGKLLRNYTQNIDTLETRAGVKRVIQCHGSFATASCINCHQRFPGNAIEDDILNQRVPVCKTCPPVLPPAKPKPKKKNKKKNLSVWEQDDDDDEPDVPNYPPGIIKPDITFFGEKLSNEFDKSLAEDRPLVDLLLVIGTSLKVSPVSDTLTHLRHSVPQILINKTPIRHINPDIVLLGNADDIIQHLVHQLNWELPEQQAQTSTLRPNELRTRKRSSEGAETRGPRRVGNSHVWLFEGAEGGKWVADLEQRHAQKNPEMSVQLANEDGGSKMKKARVS
ncbi:hypothetical protein QCA50_009000 [Cerrena zonata]|uniref:Deacetylase sirtuin-type domain-containing protein n=1 Tax=Cerrena zonata TaxID=2478898 RepID=A0AAW0GDS4_9APHY